MSSSGGVWAAEEGWQSGRGSSNGTTTAIFLNNRNDATPAVFDANLVSGENFSLEAVDLGETLQNGGLCVCGCSTAD